MLLTFPGRAKADVIPTTNWQLVYVDSQELVGENGAATNAFDGNTATFWHTQWAGANPPPPHEIQIDMGNSYQVNGFRYLPRQDGSPNGRIGQYEFYVSSDGVSWGSPVATGTFANNALIKEIAFAAKTGRYLRLRALSEVNGSAWTSMAELTALSVNAPPDPSPNGVISSPSGNISITAGQSVQFAGSGSSPGGNLPLSYRWQFGTGSGLPDSTLQNPGSLLFTTPGTYQITLTVTDSTGLVDPTPATRTINVTPVSPVISPANWKLLYADSQELAGEDGAAVNAFDGNPAKFWHTQWSVINPPPPHEIRIDLGQAYDLYAFRYLPRQDGTSNGNIGQYEFYVSSDGTNWGVPAATGTFANNALEKEVTFPTARGQYIRLRALTEVNGRPWTCVAELKVLGSVVVTTLPNGLITAPAGNISINLDEEVQFSGNGSSPNGSVPLSYHWQFGTGSGIADSSLQNPGLVRFTIPGTYVVSLTVTDSTGAADPTPAKVTVVVNDPNVSFTPDWKSVTVSPFNLVQPTTVSNPVLTKNDVTDIAAEYVADPYLFFDNNSWYLFFEVFSAEGKGTISVATSPDALHWHYDRTVLSESWHLSYPHVFKVNNKYYMTPESSAIGEVRLYESTNFPYDWNYAATLVSGRGYVDPNIFYHDNTWWMFASDGSNLNMYLFYSDDLTGGWVEHPRSPVIVNDAGVARNGGRIFVYDGNKIIRCAQKDDVFYGESVRLFQIDTLTRTEFSEHELPESPLLGASGSGWNSHQFDPWWNGQYWVSVLDGRIGTPDNWEIGIYLSADPASPNGSIQSPTGAVTINAGGTVQFSGSGSSPSGNLPLTYRWQFGQGSGIPESSLQNPGVLQFAVPGTYQVTMTVTDSTGRVDPTPAVVNVNVMATSPVIPTTNWTVRFVDSQELIGENGAALNAFDGNPATIWHTQWAGSNPPPPHEIQIDMGQAYDVSAFRYLPRQDDSGNGRIGQYEFYVSSDGITWGTPVATGSFANNALEKEVIVTTKRGRYIRLRAVTEAYGNPWTSMAELKVLGQ